MAIQIYKPVTPSRRKMSVIVQRGLDNKRPEQKLIQRLKQQAGRNQQGKITVRHRGGGHRVLYRTIDFKQDRYDQPAEVIALEYDPNRTANIALVRYSDDKKRYIIAPQGLERGATVTSSKNKIEIKVGNRLPLKYIPSGMMVCNVELVPGKGGKIVRAAGTGATVLALDGGFVQLKLPSSEVRKIFQDCLATIGQVSNIERKSIRYGKAGRMRWRGIRPSVRGKAMNPVDHPHGGGEGNQPIGLKHPKTPWGKPALGYRTREKNKYSDTFIIKRREKG